MMQECDLLPVQVIIPTGADFCILAIKQKVCLKLTLNYASVIYNVYVLIIMLAIFTYQYQLIMFIIVMKDNVTLL